MFHNSAAANNDVVVKATHMREGGKEGKKGWWVSGCVLSKGTLTKSRGRASGQFLEAIRFARCIVQV